MAKHGGGGILTMLKDHAPKPRPGGIDRARKLRGKMTLPEVLLWQQLRTRPHGLKFRRQHETGDFVLDFYCGDARLAIEVDGKIHDIPNRAERDGSRDAWLQVHHIDTLRLAASEVLADPIAAAQAIVDFTRARPPPTTGCAGRSPSRDKLGEDQQ